MKKLSLDEFNLIIKDCVFRLDPQIKQLSIKSYPKGSGNNMLLLEFFAPKNITGISKSNEKVEQIWLLERQVELKNGLLGLSKKDFFEFEIISDDNDDRMLIETNFLLPILKDLTLEYPQFSTTHLVHTIGLQDNLEIKGWHKQTLEDKFSQTAYQPKEFYDKNFGSKSQEERQLIKSARDIVEESYGNGHLESVKLYSKALELNPQNAFSLFNRGLARMDAFEFEMHTIYINHQSDPSFAKQKVESLKQVAIKESESDFKMAIALHPYLKDDYDKLKIEGRIL